METTETTLHLDLLDPTRRLAFTTCVAIAFVVSALPFRAAQADSLDGIWTVEDRSAKVRIGPCGDALCGRVILIEEPNDPKTGAPWVDKNNVDPSKRARPLLGISVASGMKLDGTSNKWIGRVYSIDHGRDFAGSITLLSPTRLKIEGCQMIFCQSEIWTKSE